MDGTIQKMSRKVLQETLNQADAKEAENAELEDDGVVEFDDFLINDVEHDIDFRKNLKNLFYNLDDVDDQGENILQKFRFTYDPKQGLTDVALKSIYNAIYALQHKEQLPDLEEKLREEMVIAEAKYNTLSEKRNVQNETEHEYSLLKTDIYDLENAEPAFKERAESLVKKGDKTEANTIVGKFRALVNTLFKIQGRNDMVWSTAGDIINNLNTIIDNAPTTVDAAIEVTCLDAVGKMYAAASDGKIDTDFISKLNDPNSDDYKNILFNLLVNEVPTSIVGPDGPTGPLYSISGNLSEILFKVADKIGDKKSFILGCYDFLSHGKHEAGLDTEADKLAQNGGAKPYYASSFEGTRWEYTWSIASHLYTDDPLDMLKGDKNDLYNHFWDTAKGYTIGDRPFFQTIGRVSELQDYVMSKFLDDPENKLMDLKMEMLNKAMENPNTKQYLNARIENYKRLCQNGEIVNDLKNQAKIIERYFYSNSGNPSRPNKDGDGDEYRWDGLVALQAKYKNPKVFFDDAIGFAEAKWGFVWYDNLSTDIVENAKKNGQILNQLAEDKNSTASNDVIKAQNEYYVVQSSVDKLLQACESLRSDPKNLLNLALRYCTFDGTGVQITKITCKDGKYFISGSQDAGSPSSEMVTTEKAIKHLAIHYYALAMCLEKAYVVMDIMVAQLEIIGSINKEIENNNEYLRLANAWYSEYYKHCIEKDVSGVGVANFSSRDTRPDSIHTLREYVVGVCDFGTFQVSGVRYGVYNDEGTEGNGNKSNIDVEEQGNLTMISNAQEAIRMRGDKWSMEQQVATVKLQQLIQNFAACITICSQLCKIIGDYIRSITNNVRF